MKSMLTNAKNARTSMYKAMPKTKEAAAAYSNDIAMLTELEMKVSKAEKIATAVVDGVREYNAIFNKMADESSQLGTTFSSEEMAKNTLDAWQKVVDNVISSRGIVTDQMKQGLEEARFAYERLMYDKENMERTYSDASSMLGSQRSVDSARIALSSVTPGDRVGMMKAATGLKLAQLDKDTEQSIIDHKKRLYKDLMRAKANNDKAAVEGINRELSEFEKAARLKQAITKNTLEVQLEAATAYEERMKQLRESDAIDAMGKVFGLGSEQQKWMKIGATRNDRATRDSYAAMGMSTTVGNSMDNALGRIGYADVAGGFANVGTSYNKFMPGAYQWFQPTEQEKTDIIGADGMPINPLDPGAISKQMPENLKPAVIGAVGGIIDANKGELEKKGGEGNVQLGRIALDTKIDIKVNGPDGWNATVKNIEQLVTPSAMGN
jgi:hypothetical protein